MKKYLLVIALLLGSFLSFSQCQWQKDLRKELYSQEALENGFLEFFEKDNVLKSQAYKILHEEANDLRNNLDELSLVRNNLDEIKRVGGYKLWKEFTAIIDQFPDNLKNYLKEAPMELLNNLVKLEEKGKLERFIDHFKKVPSNFSEIKEKPSLINSWNKLDDLEESVFIKDIDWLKRVDDWNSSGIQLSKNEGNLKLLDGSGDTLGEFKNGELIPETGKYANIGTPKGDVVNGYQVVDNGGQLGIKRVPDRTSYSASELTELTQHPNAHVLERHGHDVPDEALIKRANEGVAPDGSTIGNPNNPIKPFSSKFESSDKLKLALSKVKPGTPAFANKIQDPNFPDRYKVIFEATDGTIFGKGVPRNGNSFQQLTKVEARYQEVSSGVFQLVTMFPTR